MCFKWFKKQTPGQPVIVKGRISYKGIPEGLTLPYPEEPHDPTRTVSNTSIQGMLAAWLKQRAVPEEYREYWTNQIEINLYDIWPKEVITRYRINSKTPAFAFGSDGKRYLFALAPWFNIGVIAHEQAHNSYALLTDPQRAEFRALYEPLISTEPYIRLLYSINHYGLSSIVEGHAELYRYLGEKLPIILKAYYPKLFRG